MFRLRSGLYFSACLGSLRVFLSILCTCCSHFFWYCFICFTIFCAPVFPLIHWFFSLSNFVILSKCLKNFICAVSKRCSSLFFIIQASIYISMLLFICSVLFPLQTFVFFPHSLFLCHTVLALRLVSHCASVIWNFTASTSTNRLEHNQRKIERLL